MRSNPSNFPLSKREMYVNIYTAEEKMNEYTERIEQDGEFQVGLAIRQVRCEQDARGLSEKRERT